MLEIRGFDWKVCHVLGGKEKSGNFFDIESGFVL